MAFLSSFLSAHLLDRAGGHRRCVRLAFEEKTKSDRELRNLREKTRLTKLANLVRHACQNAPYYRNFVKNPEIITPDSVLPIISEWPLLTRSIIQKEGDNLLAEKGGEAPFVQDSTGGSTGTPMIFQVDRSTQIARESSLLWADSLSGWRMGEKMAMLWGSDRDLNLSFSSWRLHLRWWIENRLWLNAFEMGPRELANYHRVLQRFRPAVLVAYAGAARALAAHLDERQERSRYPSRAVITSAEVLSDEARRMIERVFRVSVYDRYGDREFGAIAAECSAHSGLHVNESDVWLEVESHAPFSEPGNIIITYLHNRRMPFIRYDTGDMAILAPQSPCSCGRTTSRILKIAGRQSDMIKAQDGTAIHGEFFTHLFYGVKGVFEFQFIQESSERCRLLIVGDSKSLTVHEKDWRNAILSKIGKGVALDFQYLEKIPQSLSGKHRFTISKIK